MYLSKSGRIYTKEKADTQPIYLIYQYFVHRDASRNKELQECLRKNVENPHITKIYLLNEKIYDKKELGIDSSKIEQINIVNRIKFKNIFNFVEKESLKGYIVTCNADIFFDKTIDNLRKSTMSTKKQLLAQLRFDYTNKQLGKCKLFGPRADSQDAWIWHSNFNPNKEEKIFNIMFGKPGCDNKLIYLFNLIGFDVINQPYFVKTYHIQKDNKRDYDGIQTLPGPYMMKSPYIQNRQMTYTDIWGTVGWRLKNTHKTSIEATTNNFNRFLLEEDNEIMVKYLRKQIEDDNNFFIPQTEINGTVLASVVIMINSLTNGELFATGGIDENKHSGNLQIKHLWNVLIQLLNQMNRSEFQNIRNLLAYSTKYMDAFQKSNLFVRGQLAGGLVGREHVDPAGVARLVGVRGGQEGGDEVGRLLLGVHAGADGDNVGVVVLAAEGGGLLAPGEGAADALDLVGGDLLAVAGAADDDAERVGVGGGPLGRPQAERRVVVGGVVDVGAAVHRVVAVGLQPVDEVVLEFVAGMVGAEVHAHEGECGMPGAG